MTVNNTKIQFWTEMIIIVSRDLCKIRNLDIALTNYSSFPVEILNSGTIGKAQGCLFILKKRLFFYLSFIKCTFITKRKKYSFKSS